MGKVFSGKSRILSPKQFILQRSKKFVCGLPEIFQILGNGIPIGRVVTVKIHGGGGGNRLEIAFLRKYHQAWDMRCTRDDDEPLVVFGEFVDFILRIAAVILNHFDLFRRNAEKREIVTSVRQTEVLGEFLLEFWVDRKGDSDSVVDSKLLEFMGDTGGFKHAGGHGALKTMFGRQRLVEDVVVAEDGDDVWGPVCEFLRDMERFAFVFELHAGIPAEHGIQKEQEHRQDDGNFSYLL